MPVSVNFEFFNYTEFHRGGTEFHREKALCSSLVLRISSVQVLQIILYKKAPQLPEGLFYIRLATSYSPTFAVPSALTGLTSLFGMGRGGSPSL